MMNSTGRWTAILLVVLMSGCASPETRRDKFLARGKDFLQKRDFNRAMIEFRNAGRATPRDAEPYYYAGLVNLQTGDLQAALMSFRKALEFKPSHAEAKLRLTQLMNFGEKPVLEEAEQNLRELMAAGPATPEMLNTLAVTELRLGRKADAIATLEQVLARAPGELTASLLLARTKLKENDARGAEEILKKAAAAAPQRPEPQIALGRFYMSQNRTGEAEQAVRQALQISPDNWLAMRDLAVLQNASGRKQEAAETFQRLSKASNKAFRPIYALFLFSERRYDESVREFERLTREEPNDRDARSRLIMAYQATNRNQDADRLLSAALKNNPRDIDALLQRAQIFIAGNRTPEAETDLNQVLQLKPDLADAHYLVARLNRARGARLQYRQSLTRALEYNPAMLPARLELAGEFITERKESTALDLLNKAPNEQKQSLTLLAQRNWAMWSANDLAGMRKGIDAALSIERSGEFLLQDGLCKLAMNNPVGAQASLEEALKLSPGDVRALTGLKQAFVAMRQPAMAVQKAKEYASAHPKSAPVQQFLGYLLWANGDRTAARAAFTAAKAADPKFENADLALVQLDAMDLKWDSAASRLHSVVAANPGNTTARLWLGNIESLRGNSSAALEQFRRVVEANPDNPQALNNFAYLLSEHVHQDDEALKYAQKAQELSPENPQYADTLGWILYRKGMYPSAIRHLERAVSKKPEAVSGYHLAMAYAKAGDRNRSRTAFEQALKLNPNLPEAKAAKDLLAGLN